MKLKVQKLNQVKKEQRTDYLQKEESPMFECHKIAYFRVVGATSESPTQNL